MNPMTREQISDAVRDGVIAAMQSDEAQEEFDKAVNRWFDRTSGKAMRRVFGSLVLALFVFIASNASYWKTLIARL